MNSKIMIIVGQLEAGIGRHVKNFCEYVDPNVHIFTNIEQSDPRFLDELRELSVEVESLPISKKPGINDIKNLFFLRKQLGERSYVKIIGHGAKGGMYARCLSSLCLSKKSYYVPHGGVLHYNHNSLAGICYFYIEKILFFLTHKILFESEYSKISYNQKVWKLNESDYAILSNCIEMDKIRESKNKKLSRSFDNEKLKICCAAQLRDLKGIDVLLEALSSANLPASSYVCDIYGSGTKEDENRYRKYVHDVGLSEAVQFKGVGDVFRLYADYDLYIQPSRFESFGLAALEAYFAGCDLILSNTGGLLNNFRDAPDVTFFETGSVASLREALECYRRKKSKSNRASFLERYHPDFFRSKYLEALNDE